jgi:hypothetical protein
MPSHPERVRANYGRPTGSLVPYFRGKRASQLTRDELLQAYGAACAALVRERSWQRENIEMERLFDEARKRINA